MTAPARVALIVEDDTDVSKLLEVVLTPAGFETHSVTSGNEAVELARTINPVIVTLDISLPDIDGFEVARRIRTFSNAYIVMLTARAGEIDALQGLDAGADDYITKPFRPRELRARIEAMLRRPRDPASEPGPAAVRPTVGPASSTPPPASGEPGIDGPSVTHVTDDDGVELHVDHSARTVLLDSENVHLTRSEFDILARLVSPTGRVATKDEISRLLRHSSEDAAAVVTTAESRRLDVHMVNLRRKLGDHSNSPRWIETVRGVGYRFRQASSI